MRDRDLEQRVDQVLAQLATLSEVGAARIGRSSASSDEEHGIPAGVSPNPRRREPDRPPPKDRSLYDFYRWHFGRARNDSLRRVLLFMAEGDLKARKWAIPEGKIALAGAGSEQGEKRDERIIAFFAGTHPLEAAMLESHHGGYCSEENIRAVRRKARRDPETGHPLPGWHGWDDERRTKEVHRLRGSGRSLAQIAAELGTTKASANRYLTGYKRRAA